MAGKMCTGTINVPNNPILSRAYCEGRDAAAAGALVGTNPHLADTEISDIWISGFDSYSADPTGVTRDCCAVAYGAGYTP